jgi:sulfhydrogenase subunit beta (sulfur reductase)
MQSTTASVIDPGALESLVEVLRRRGFRVLGPQVRDGAIVYDDLASAAELPIGWKDVQEPGRYRLERRADSARFGYAVGPHSWKQFLFPPRLRLWAASRTQEGFAVTQEPPPDRPLALIGVRACELHGIAIQDTVFLGGPHTDDEYAARRKDAFVVAVNCFEPAGTCFCVSMGTGPKAELGYDLALTEVMDGPHRLVAEAGSDRGAAVLAELPRRDATAADLDAAGRAVAGAAERMGRSVDTDDLPGLLSRNLEHARWDDVADRCLTCGNCTLVCPTCFCSGVEDHTDLTGQHAERVRVWDSCFGVEHSYMHGGPIRSTGRSRYRQWLTHKFGTWHEQFGSSGCIGCGRCITWCPVGIDVTEELAAIRAGEEASA